MLSFLTASLSRSPPPPSRPYADVKGCLIRAEGLAKRATTSPKLPEKHKKYIETAAKLIITDIKTRDAKYMNTCDERCDIILSEICEGVLAGGDPNTLIDRALPRLIATHSDRLTQLKALLPQ